VSSPQRIVVWFSCGAASAVAAKVITTRYKNDPTFTVEVVNINMEMDEHEDNIRFRNEVESWIGHPIVQIKSDKYKGIDDVFLSERYIAGVTGAACTKRLKRQVSDSYEKPDDLIVIGFTYDEQDRIALLESHSANRTFLWVLANARIRKQDCYHILSAGRIALPQMYLLGFNNNNCIGCVKGGKGYWNKIRVLFPDVFWRRAKIEREIGFPILRDVWLDELDPKAGMRVREPPINCGLFCEGFNDLVPLAAANL
jgi:hypothetical protein